MILINMMMAIINLSFEEIKTQKDAFQNKFELMDYIKRSIREMVGITLAEPIVPIYKDNASKKDQRLSAENSEELMDTELISEDFSLKTNLLFQYIEQTYFSGGGGGYGGEMDEESAQLMSKLMPLQGGMEGGDEDRKARAHNFDTLFMSETNSPASSNGGDEMEEEED